MTLTPAQISALDDLVAYDWDSEKESYDELHPWNQDHIFTRLRTLRQALKRYKPNPDPAPPLKTRDLNRATKILRDRGYTFGVGEFWHQLPGAGMAFRYLRKGDAYFAATVSTCTAQLLIEVLTQSEFIKTTFTDIEE